MQENNLTRRVQLAMDMLSVLGDVFEKLRQSATTMEETSASFHREIYEQNRHEVEATIDKYKQNIVKMRQLNMDATEKINNWFMFAKNPQNTGKLGFPLRFHLKRREMQKTIKKCNDQVYDLTLENRFCRDQLVNWEHDLGLRAAREMKKGKAYSEYEKLLLQKEELTAELKYLLPSLPGLCPVDLDWNSLGLLKEKLKSMVGE